MGQDNEHPKRPGHFYARVSETDDRLRCSHPSHTFVADANVCAFDAVWQKHAQRSAIREFIRDVVMDDRAHDPYAAVSEANFSLLHALTVLGEDIPAEYDYRPAPHIARGELVPGEDDNAIEVTSMVRGGATSVAGVRHMLRVTLRYRELVRLAGRDY
jgi:hypothetical protein